MANPHISDLSPLKGVPLSVLSCKDTHVTDLSPLGGLPLENLSCDFDASRDAKVLRTIKTLKSINAKPAAEFWKEVDAAERPDASAWGRLVAAMPAAEQVAAVAARLKELNPGFDGQVTPAIENDVVTGLEFFTDHVTNVAPVRALTGLRSLRCGGSGLGDGEVGKGRLGDLLPLKGMKLTALDCEATAVQDLAPLDGMPLTSLNLNRAPVRDLSPLRGMPLASLTLHECRKVSDLAPLKGLPLATLDLSFTTVRDLTPLKGMPLTSLALWDCRGVSDLEPLRGMKLDSLVLERAEQVSDLAPLAGTPLTSLSVADCPRVRDLGPLKGMPLKSLRAFNTGVTDLTPLRGMPLEYCSLPNPHDITQGLEILRDMKSLRNIGAIGYGQDWPAAAFWERYDKGEFGK